MYLFRFLLCVAVIGLWGPLWGQMIRPDYIPEQRESMFNPEFIRKWKIKTMEGKVSIKYDNRKIQNSPESVFYRFNEKGLLIKSVTRAYVAHRLDSQVTYYHYTGENILEHLILNDAYGWVAYCFRHNDQQEVVSIRYCRLKDPWVDAGHSLCQNVIWMDSVTTENGVRIYAHDGHRAYKKELLQKDEEGRLLRKEIRYLRGGNFTILNCDREGSTTTISKTESVGGNTSQSKWTMTFSGHDRLNEMMFYEEEDLQYRKVFNYLDSGIMDFELQREPDKGVIRIMQYSYGYY